MNIEQVKRKNIRNIYFLLLLGLSGTMNAQTPVFEDEWVPKEFTPPVSTMDYNGGVSGDPVTITIDVNDTINKILPTILGNNLPGWRSSLYGEKTIAEHIKRVNFPKMRIPGGNWSNTWFWDGINHWDGSNSDGYSGKLKQFSDTQNYLDVITNRPVKTWTLTTDQMLQICDDWGAEPQICVNYALARYIDAPDAVQQAAHYAAEWVRYVKKQGYNVKYWEIGNEHYGSWEAGFLVEGDTITGAEYGRDACVFIDSMKAADPDIKVGIGINTGKEYWVPEFSNEAVREAGDKADFIITHDYFTWASDPNTVAYSEILNAIPKISTDYDVVQTKIKQYTNKDSIPVAMTEYHYFAGLKETEGVAILFFSHALGEYMANNYGLVNYWDIQNGSGVDDHGMFTYDETGIEDNIPHPSFFPYYFYNKMFGDALTSSVSSDSEVFAYSSLFSNGYAAVVVINQSASAKDITLNFPGLTLCDTVYRYELSTPELSSRKIYINGMTSADGELYAPRDYYNIDPYIQEALNNSLQTGVEKYSVNFFVFRVREPATAISGNKKAPDISLIVLPNPASTYVNIRCSLPEGSNVKLEIYSNTGQLVDILHEGFMPQGKEMIRFDVNRLSPGIYFVKLQSDQGCNRQN